MGAVVYTGLVSTPVSFSLIVGTDPPQGCFHVLTVSTVALSDGVNVGQRYYNTFRFHYYS